MYDSDYNPFVDQLKGHHGGCCGTCTCHKKCKTCCEFEHGCGCHHKKKHHDHHHCHKKKIVKVCYYYYD